MAAVWMRRLTSWVMLSTKCVLQRWRIICAVHSSVQWFMAASHRCVFSIHNMEINTWDCWPNMSRSVHHNMRHIACTADCLKTHAMRIELDIGRAIVHDKPTSCSIYRFGFVLRLCIRTHLPTLARFNVQRPVGRTSEYCCDASPRVGFLRDIIAIPVRSRNQRSCKIDGDWMLMPVLGAFCTTWLILFIFCLFHMLLLWTGSPVWLCIWRRFFSYDADVFTWADHRLTTKRARLVRFLSPSEFLPRAQWACVSTRVAVSEVWQVAVLY